MRNVKPLKRFMKITSMRQRSKLAAKRIDAGKYFVTTRYMVGIKQCSIPTLARHLGYWW